MNEEQKEKWYNSFTREQLIERCEYLQRSCERKEQDIAELYSENVTLSSIIKEVREIFKDYGEKEDIVGYSMYNITGEMLLKLLEILDKENK